MTTQFQLFSRASIVALAAAGAAFAAPRSAHAQADDQPAALEEVIVTARKREENLQDVPISVTAITGNELAKQNIVMVSQMALTVPNFQFTHTAGDPASVAFTIRGQSNVDVVPTLDSPVAVYVDGVLWARAVGANAALVDVAGVEVLKGPQGTLFGRNTTGGAVSIRTHDPETDGFRGAANFTVAEYRELNGSIVLNVPLVQNVAALRFAYAHNEHEGYDRNVITGVRGNSENNDTFRAKLLVEPGERTRLVASYEAFNLDQVAPWTQVTYIDPASVTALIAQLTGNTALVAQALNAPPHTAYSNDAFNNAAKARTRTASLTATQDLGFATLKVIGGYRTLHSTSHLPFDSLPFVVFRVEPQVDANKEKSLEIQLNGRGLSDRLQYTLGLYGFSETGTYGYSAQALPALNPNNPSVVNGRTKNTSKAAFMQANYKITDQLSFTGGLRISKDKKALTARNGFYNPQGQFSCTLPDLTSAPFSGCLASFKTDSSDLDYLASLDYKFTPDVLAYAKISHGYRAGGLNIRGGVDAASFGEFAPETALTYETGLKSEFFDRRVRLNLAAYLTEFSDIQRTIVVPSGNTTLTVVRNAAKGEIKGGEAEIQAIVAPGLRLSGAFGLTDAHYKEFADLKGDHSKERFPNTPKYQFSFSADYTRDAPGGSVNLHGDYGWVSRTYYNIGYSVSGTSDPAFPIETISAAKHGLLNVRATYSLEGSGVDLAIFGRNITNEKYRTATGDFVSPGLGFNFATYGPPSVWGAQVTYRFGQ